MDINELRRISAKEELSLNYVAKDEAISKALSQIHDSETIIMKEGTAINRVYIGNKRFSEDIDFDIITKDSVKSTLKKTDTIIKAISGFQIDKPRIMNNTIRYDLYYQNPLNQKDKIRLEFKPVSKPEKYSKKVINFGFVPYEASSFNVYNVEVLIKHKVECILNRFEGKDFFDLYYLLDLKHNKLKIDKKKLIERIYLEKEKIKSLYNVANHYVPKSKRPIWQNFLNELKEKLNKY